ncbi:MAG TPA: ABC transporter ATP-binding protein [Methanolinea sp.]|jgi:lipopolysaccharide transport system ATP-binding protein|nr:ABC transporter ATP-binding protein [Methanolinea sp.]
MNERAYIEFKSVSLDYSSLAFHHSSLKEFAVQLFSRRPKPKITDIHALKNISFTIQAGERVALLGHNGAGKTTLLKAAAGLYPISGGFIQTSGLIRSLFEISLGFEPEATGRENILYRGLLLGLKPKYIREIEEEIIAFADIGEFIDYPVKTYSTGMLVRLAFAISTIVPGDILLLDEIIGAGDAGFMAKAKQRIESLIAKSQIVMLASHDFSAVKSLCNRAIVLHKGEIVFDGDVEKGINCAKRLQGVVQ